MEKIANKMLTINTKHDIIKSWGRSGFDGGCKTKGACRDWGFSKIKLIKYKCKWWKLCWRRCYCCV